MATSLSGVAALMAGVLLAATVVGTAVLAWCPGRERPLSIAPVLGIAVWVLWLSAVGLVLPPGSWPAVASLCAASLVLVASAVVRRLETARAMLREWPGLAASILIGFFCVSPFLAIIADAHSSALIHLTGNHDGFFFTAIPEWLRSHNLVGSPHLQVDGTPGGTPLIGSTWDIVQQGSWRVGSESFTAAVSRASGVEPLDLWFPITLVYLVSFATAAHSLADRLGARGWRAPLIAGVATASAASLGAVLDQHTPTVLALAVALVLIGELTRGPELTDEGAAPLIVAIGTGTVAAVYTELFALIALPIIVLVAVPWWRRRRIDIRWIGAVLAWSVLVAGAPMVRAARGFVTGTKPTEFPSAYRAEDGWFNILHSVASGSGHPVSDWSTASWLLRLLTVGFIFVLVTGLGGVCWKGRARAFWAALVVTVMAGWWKFQADGHSGYAQQRLVEWATPLLILGALVGWSAMADRLGNRRRGQGPGSTPRASAAILVVAMVVLAAPGIERAAGIDDDPSRRVDSSFTTMAHWVGDRDADGADTVVYAKDYFTNLWAPYVLDRQTRTSYVTLYRDYYGLDHFRDLHGRRWLVVDRAALDGARIPTGAVVESNRRFALIDLKDGPVVIEVPPLFRGRWSADRVGVTVRFDHETVSCRADGRILPCD